MTSPAQYFYAARMTWRGRYLSLDLPWSQAVPDLQVSGMQGLWRIKVQFSWATADLSYPCFQDCTVQLGLSSLSVSTCRQTELKFNRHHCTVSKFADAFAQTWKDGLSTIQHHWESSSAEDFNGLCYFLKQFFFFLTFSYLMRFSSCSAHLYTWLSLNDGDLKDKSFFFSFLSVFVVLSFCCHFWLTHSAKILDCFVIFYYHLSPFISFQST